jgi:hypothetical protein
MREMLEKIEIDNEKIEGGVARFKCEPCNYVITVSKPKVKTPNPSPPEINEEKGSSSKIGRLGLRGKIFLRIHLYGEMSSL